VKTERFLKNWVRELHQELEESQKRERESQKLFMDTLVELKQAKDKIASLEGNTPLDTKES
jgi:hypothetical protein